MSKPGYQKENQSTDMSHIKQWIQGAFVFFFLTSLLGATMRFYWIDEIPFLDYRHLLHAHSHTALLGWGFMLVTGIFLFLFVTEKPGTSIVKKLLLIIIASNTGMFVSFIYQGFGAVSIAFTLLLVLTSYVFAWYFFKTWQVDQHAPYKPFIRWAFIWQLISTLGLWAIPLVSTWLGKSHPLYHMSVQFFLHFQFNGWFSYAIIGLLLYYVTQKGNRVQIPAYGFHILQLSLLLTYAQSITWSNPLQTIFYFNSLGVLLQALAFIIIFRGIWKVRSVFHHMPGWVKAMLIAGIGSLLFKVLVQTLVVMPQVATISYTIRNYVIGFIHMIMLGALTMTGGFMVTEFKLFENNTMTRNGWIILMAGYVLTEIILFGQGTLLWMHVGYINHYYTLIFGATLLLPIAIGILTIGNRSNFNIRKVK